MMVRARREGCSGHCGLCCEFSQPTRLNTSLTSGQGPLQTDGARRGSARQRVLYSRNLILFGREDYYRNLHSLWGRGWGHKMEGDPARRNRGQMQGRDWGAQKQQEEEERKELWRSTPSDPWKPHSGSSVTKAKTKRERTLDKRGSQRLKKQRQRDF